MKICSIQAAGLQKVTPSCACIRAPVRPCNAGQVSGYRRLRFSGPLARARDWASNHLRESLWGRSMVEIFLHNSRTRQKQALVPIDASNVRMYVCGPTVYDRAHLGNARPVLVFDVLFRLLRHIYGPAHVTYVRNFTDVDDKINARAAATGRSIRDITDQTIGWYHADMDTLGALRPTHEPRATEWIGAMVAMIETLIARGHAYTAQGHVLFDVHSYGQYGALSGRSVDDMIAGARVEIAPFKRDPMDFVLWKPSDGDQPGWPSPWGYGRPGWHIECSAMAHGLLGASFDIHGGGLDLQFPHHENEIAQSCCAHPEGVFAKIWLHNEMLLVEGRKMSKSLGNFFTVRDLLDRGVAGEVIRYVMLMTQYRKPMDWTEAKMREAETSLRRWRGLVAGIDPAPSPAASVVEALADDLGTPAALTALHALAAVGDRSGLLASAQLLGLLQPALGDWYAPDAPDLSALSAHLWALREQAMKLKDFSAVDVMKADLVAAGIEVRMSREGLELLPGQGFDPVRAKDLGQTYR